MALPTVALPGQLLGPASKYAPGPGTHIHSSQIYASLAGRVSTTTTKSSSNKTLPLLTISHTIAPSSPGILGPASGSGAPILPHVSSIVLAKITRLGSRFASAEILTVDSSPVVSPLLAQIRKEDIRATEKDKVKVEESFRVGDVVRGEVISLGDTGTGYYVSCARNEFGVVLAWGEGDEEALGGEGEGEGVERRLLEPVSWCEMRDPRTGRREVRKVAKPF